MWVLGNRSENLIATGLYPPSVSLSLSAKDRYTPDNNNRHLHRIWHPYKYHPNSLQGFWY